MLNSNTIYIVKKDKKTNFHFIPFKFMEGEIIPYNWNEGLDAFYKDSLESERHRQVTNEMDKLAKNELKKSEKKIKKLQEELDGYIAQQDELLKNKELLNQKLEVKLGTSILEFFAVGSFF